MLVAMLKKIESSDFLYSRITAFELIKKNGIHPEEDIFQVL